MTQPELDIHDHIRELTTEHSHREPYVLDGETRQLHHWTKVPALVVQLQGARDILGPEGDSGSRGAPTSKPATRIEAVDTLALIAFEAGDWCYRLDSATPADTVRRLQRVHGLHPSTPTCGGTHWKNRSATFGWCCQRRWLEHDIQRWWQQARITTGWDMPAFKPRATCPLCGAKGTLRVKLDGALCVEPKCRATWDASQVGLLGEHVRVETEGDPAPACA
jgi:hypothetical protein